MITPHQEARPSVCGPWPRCAHRPCHPPPAAGHSGPARRIACRFTPRPFVQFYGVFQPGPAHGRRAAVVRSASFSKAASDQGPERSLLAVRTPPVDAASAEQLPDSIQPLIAHRSGPIGAAVGRLDLQREQLARRRRFDLVVLDESVLGDRPGLFKNLPAMTWCPPWTPRPSPARSVCDPHRAVHASRPDPRCAPIRSPSWPVLVPKDASSVTAGINAQRRGGMIEPFQPKPGAFTSIRKRRGRPVLELSAAPPTATTCAFRLNEFLDLSACAGTVMNPNAFNSCQTSNPAALHQRRGRRLFILPRPSYGLGCCLERLRERPTSPYLPWQAAPMPALGIIVNTTAGRSEWRGTAPLEFQ